MARNDYFSVGKLEVSGLEIRVRYRTRRVDDVFSTKNVEQLSPTSTTSNVSQQDLILQSYDKVSRQGSSEV